MTKNTETTSTEAQDEQALKRAAYNAAEQSLKMQYQSEFRALVQEEAAKRGVTYEFRKTAAEKAAVKLQEILSQFPELREQVTE